ncbi:MAG: hypothetical protein LBR31_00990 [Desulfovibrio sp.]|jgi:hypothetical protein|nr:hypothetical protein [Desulfovibrio sp.]
MSETLDEIIVMLPRMWQGKIELRAKPCANVATRRYKRRRRRPGKPLSLFSHWR